MQEAEFDKFADEYHAMHLASIGASGEGPEYFAAYKIDDLAWEHTRRQPALHAPKIMDFGAGSGNSVPHMRRAFPNAQLTCVDVSARSLQLAESRFPAQARYQSFDGTRLPFADDSFDIGFAACVFHHIEHGQHTGLLHEWHRVLQPGGMALIYEHNPYNPMTRRVVDLCPFDENAHLITARQMRHTLLAAGFAGVQVHYRVYFPHALRALRRFERTLAGVPLGAQYYAVGSKA